MHMIDMTNERANIAFAGEAPWHSLGTPMVPGQTIEEWRVAAGLSHDVHGAVVEYKVPGVDESKLYGDRKVLYRSDTQAPLSIVGSDYKIVQPRQVLDFFVALIERNKFQMECAGALDEGRKVWALARVNDGDCVVGEDRVRPYILLATSYDTSMSTVAKFTEVRVVCNNTLTAAAGGNGREGLGQSEVDNQEGRIVNCVRIPHTDDFDPTKVRMDLSIALDAHERFIIEARRLAKITVGDKFPVEFLRNLLPKSVTKATSADGIVTKVEKPVEETRAFKSIMALFKGEALGSGLPGTDGTAWQLLNAVSQHVDHQRGRTDDSRMNSAWFGSGEALKNKALAMLVEAC